MTKAKVKKSPGAMEGRERTRAWFGWLSRKVSYQIVKWYRCPRCDGKMECSRSFKSWEELAKKEPTRCASCGGKLKTRNRWLLMMVR